MKYITGCHLSIASGYEKACQNAIEAGANTFQFFTRNPRGGNAKPIEENDLVRFKGYIDSGTVQKVLVHAPYTINLASAKEEVRSSAIELLKSDNDIMDILPSYMYNIHPGSHTGIGIDKGIENIIDAINQVFDGTKDYYLLLETMSGKGTEIGSRFEEIKRIIDGIDHNEKVGVCLDTCHIYCAGYDLVNEPDKVVEDFDKIIGLDKLMAIHVNDSANPFNSHKDRHANLSKGCIDIDGLARFLSNEELVKRPMFLETPHDEKDEMLEVRKEIELLHSYMDKYIR